MTETSGVAPLLTGLGPDERRRVLQASDQRSVKAGQVLFRQDEPARALHLVVSGRVKLSQLTAAGQEVILRWAGPDEAFAAIAVLDGKTYPFTATAAAATRVRLWTRAALVDLFRAAPRFQANVLDAIGAHSREMLDRFRELATEPVPQRLARALLRLLPPARDGCPRLEGVTQRELADMAATTLYTVSRVLSDWEGEGIVRTGRAKVEVRRLDALHGIANG